MESELAQFIQTSPLCDTHEHLFSEDMYVNDGPDILGSLFFSYVSADLVVAGASEEAIETLWDKSNPDIAGRFERIRPQWEAVKHTGYGEAVRILARELYGIEEITAVSLTEAQPKHQAMLKPGERLRLLRDVANLDHVQINAFEIPTLPNPEAPDFFFYDIGWHRPCIGKPDLVALAQDTGIEARDLASLKQALETSFAKQAKYAIAIKSQHAYDRTLAWRPRTDKEAAQALAAYLQNPNDYSEADQLCLGDWCWALGVELGIEHDLPFKIHTGYYAGHSRMPVDYIRSGHLTPLLARYLDARFVLMHIAYPYSSELLALAKHYPNVYADLCWAWSINPLETAVFVRRFIHSVPANKLFIFGGDTFWPGNAVAYAHQARIGLNRTLQAEVDDGLLSEAEAIRLARRFMMDNQYACFNVAAKREVTKHDK
ncbi:MAG: amidohydrolase family protein [Chloroflexota bacterium]